MTLLQTNNASQLLPQAGALAAAEPLIDAGFALHWLRPRDKMPVDAAWSVAPVSTLAALTSVYRRGANLGVRLGEPSKTDSGYAHVIDLDIRQPHAKDAARTALLRMIPEAKALPQVKSGSGGLSRHFYFFCPEPFHSTKLAHAPTFTMVYDEAKGREVKKWDWEIELFGTGKQVVLPPSVHPSGGVYRWLAPLDMEDVNYGLAPQIEPERVRSWGASSVTRHESDDEEDDDLGALMRKGPMGLTAHEIDRALTGLPEEWVEDRDLWCRAGMALHHEYEGSKEGFEHWCEWSKRSAKFNLRESRAVWKSFKGDRKDPVRMATLLQVTEGDPQTDDHDDLLTEDKPEGPFLLDAADWQGTLPPEREWLVDGWLPMGTVTSLYGDGGLGKSILALQLARAVATGRPWCGRPVTKPGKAIVLAAEDETDELRRRLHDIGEAEGVTLPCGRLLVRSLAEGDAVLAQMNAKMGGVKATALYKRVRAAVEAEKPELLVLDTLGNLFSGNENDRAQVTQFVGLLRNLAAIHKTAILLLAHPSKSGMRDGTGDSGSTGWNGTVRSRLYLSRVLIDGQEVNKNLRRLSHLKANYGPRLDPVDLVYQGGTFETAPNAVSEIEGRAQAKFLEMVDTYEGQPLHMKSGPTYAPKVFAGDSRADGFTKKTLAAAMRALDDAGEIEAFEMIKGDRKVGWGIRRVPADGSDIFGMGI